MADGGFFEGWNADKVIGLSLDVFSQKTKQDEAAATKAEADRLTRYYEASTQRSAPATEAKSPFNTTYLMIGGGVLVAALLIFKMK